MRIRSKFKQPQRGPFSINRFQRMMRGASDKTGKDRKKKENKTVEAL